VSFTTLALVKYTLCRRRRGNAFEVGIRADRRHRRKNLSEAAFARVGESGGENFAMFGLGAASVLCGALFERLHKRIVDPAHQKIGHVIAPVPLLSIIDMTAMISPRLQELKRLAG
jgi:hypothetical protein